MHFYVYVSMIQPISSRKKYFPVVPRILECTAPSELIQAFFNLSGEPKQLKTGCVFSISTTKLGVTLIFVVVREFNDTQTCLLVDLVIMLTSLLGSDGDRRRCSFHIGAVSLRKPKNRVFAKTFVSVGSY